MRRRLWLAAAVLLLALAAWLMLRGGDELPAEKTVALPRALRPAERERMQRRQTLASPAHPTPGPQRPRDPLLAALSTGAGKTALIIEANAIRNSPVGQLLIDCLARGEQGNPVELLKRELNVDVLQDLDRVAITPRGVILSGNFGNAKWDQLMGDRATSSAYGEQGTVYSGPQRRTADGGSDQDVAARWGNGLVMLGSSATDAHDSLDRIEGRTPSAPPLSEQQTYGEIYGVMSSDDLARLFPREAKDLANQLRRVADQVEIHVDTSSDVGLTATVRGSTGSPDLEDLGKSLGGLLSLARLKAQAEGDTATSELLESARVLPHGSSFDLELALPLKVLERELAWCKDPKAHGPSQRVPPP